MLWIQELAAFLLVKSTEYIKVLPAVTRVHFLHTVIDTGTFAVLLVQVRGENTVLPTVNRVLIHLSAMLTENVRIVVSTG